MTTIRISQALEDLEVDEKAQSRYRAFSATVGQEDLSGRRRVNLVEFFGCQCPFQPGVGGMLNGCHENDSLPASSLHFYVRMWYTAANIP